MERIERVQDKISIIGQLPLFCELSPKESLLVARASILVECKKGELIYAQSDPANAFYCIVTGRVKAYLQRPGGKEEVLEYLHRGKYFGIISLLTREPHSVSACAVNDSILLKIQADDFEKILKRIPRLALHLSQTLSRRLKHKDAHEKRIFESTIVSMYGSSDKIGVTTYALNLALALQSETKKDVMVLEVRKAGEAAASFAGFCEDVKPLLLSSPFFKEGEVASAVTKSDFGADLLAIPYSPGDAQDVHRVAALLSYLTNDYHYIIVDLPAYLDASAFDIMKQSDFIHLLTSSNRDELKSASRILGELKSFYGEATWKLKVITTEYGKGPPVSFSERAEILKHDIFATLPEMAELRGDGYRERAPAIVACPQCNYSKAVRRIARQVGDVLVGLALGSGAALGLAHVGVLKVFEEEKIPIDMLAGTSMGALIGALWALGKETREIEAVIGRYKTRLETIKLMDFTFPRRGIIKGGVVRSFLREQFGRRTFHDLRLPFRVVACDIQTRQEVVIDSGSLVEAVLASVSIPGVFEPVRIGEKILVDGGIINPVPTNVLSRLGVNKIIAVNTLPSPEDVVSSKKKVTNIFDIIVNSVQASEYILAQMSCQQADIALHPVLPTMDWYEFFKGSSAIRRGEEEARRFLPEIRELVSR